MRKFVLILVSLLVMTAADSGVKEKYIAQYSAIAVDEMYRAGIPASITLAQGLLESGAGLSELASKGNNHFGIKCHSDWKGKTMKVDDDAKGECFRVYKAPEESFRDHSDFLRYRDRYKFLFSYDIIDYKSWAYGLKKAGYATDPSYATKLISLIEDYDLSRFDSAPQKHERELPMTPDEIEEPKRIDLKSLDKKEDLTFSMTRPVYEKNGVPFVYSSEGETYSSIAATYHLFRKEILRFNDLQEGEELPAGTMVFIHAKKSQAAKGLDKYIVGEEPETLRGICQRFAVKLSSIRKLNSFPEDYVPSEGDTILLRKSKDSK